MSKKPEATVCVPIPDASQFSEAFLKLLWESASPIAKQHLADRVLMSLADDESVCVSQATQQVSKCVADYLDTNAVKEHVAELAKAVVDERVQATVERYVQNNWQPVVELETGKQLKNAVKEVATAAAEMRVGEMAVRAEAIISELSDEHLKSGIEMAWLDSCLGSVKSWKTKNALETKAAEAAEKCIATAAETTPKAVEDAANEVVVGVMASLKEKASSRMNHIISAAVDGFMARHFQEINGCLNQMWMEFADSPAHLKSAMEKAAQASLADAANRAVQAKPIPAIEASQSLPASNGWR